ASLILVVVALLAGRPAHIQAVEIGQDPGRDFGLAVGSVGANLLYTPPKLITALFGLMAGGVTAVATGFDLRSMYAVWVPTVTGTYFLTPAHLEGKRPIEFFGSHYPSALLAETDERAASYGFYPLSQ